MAEPDDASGRALERLDERLGAAEASRRRAGGLFSAGAQAGQGYTLLAQMVGGVLGGLGLGWLLDHFAHTAPWGVIGGLIIGAGLSIFSTVQTASTISSRAAAVEKTLPGSDED